MAPQDANCGNMMLFLGKHTPDIDLVCHWAGSTIADAGSAPVQVGVQRGCEGAGMGASSEPRTPVLLFYCSQGWHRSQ